MNENEHQFDALQRLLTLKRHEVPPPGYFNSFSGRVIAQIKAGKTSDKHSATADTTTWFSKFLQLFEFKPAFAGAFASALCLLLFFGIFYADQPEAGLQPFLQNSEQSMASFAAATPGVLPAANGIAGIISSNSPAGSLQPMASFFGSENSLVQPASFSPSGQ